MSYINQAFANTDNRSLLGSKMAILDSISSDILAKKIDGDIAECGVYKGGSARLLATVFPHKKVYLFDSFNGMQESDTLTNGHKKGDFSDTSLEQVKEYLNDKTNCLYYPGWIPESANFLTSENFCLIHLDLDLYQSTSAAIKIFWPRLVTGGVMVFDDWEWKNCPGVKRAIEEYFVEIPHERKTNNNTCAIYKK